MTPEQKEALSPSNLSNFSGSEEYFTHSLRKTLLMTEGIHFVTRNGMAWFVDIIASVQHLPKLRAEEFQSWKLTKLEGNTAEAVCDDGNGNVVYRQEIPFTDFPHD